jgi:mono/diheme cytochrome c family protein
MLRIHIRRLLRRQRTARHLLIGSLALGAALAVAGGVAGHGAQPEETGGQSEEQTAPQATAAPKEERSSDGFLVAKGRTTFRVYCANCHGAIGKGDGNLAEMLKVRPPDLTVLARKAEDGRFPREDIHARIDGRKPVAGHGSPDMPIWGDAFQKVLQPGYQDLSDDERAQLKIVELVYFLESIQQPVEP